MELTPLQLECQKLGADKELEFGCMVISPANKIYRIVEDLYIESNQGPGLCKVVFTRLSDGQVVVCDDQLDSELFDYDYEGYDNIINWETLGHPITYSRLCYLAHKKKKFDKFADLTVVFANNPELYNQSILERPEELQLLVRDFLISIQ